MVRFKMLVLCVLISLPIIAANLFAQAKSLPYKKGYAVDSNGEKVQWIRYAGFPPEKPVTNMVDPNEVYQKDGAKALVKLPGTAAYDWSYGCTATATSILVAYYDQFGAPNCYTGPANGGVAPLSNAVWQTATQTDTAQDAIAASKNGVDGRTTRGHGDDYWIAYDEAETNDPYYGNWTEHDHYAGQPATADFMGTNQWNNWGNIDGSTSVWTYNSPSGAKLIDMPDQIAPPGRDAAHGMRLFFESLGIEVQTNFNQNITGFNDPDDDPDAGPVVGGYEFADYKRSIDQGRPVLLHVIGHTMLAYGYDEAYTPPRVYMRSTWNRNYTTDAEYMSWGGVFSNMQHNTMTEIVLATKEYYATPENVLALNNNRTVTVTWSDPSEGTRPLSYIVYRDGAQIATRTVPNYSETLASTFDGVHSYSVKAVYTVPEPDYTTGFSDASSVYVCASVLSFTDTFENTWAAQWLFTPATGSTGAWGRDTQYFQAGAYSLSDSPAANYVDGTYLYPKGGSVAEVAPGLNFSAALDCQTSFYIRYQLEESFDYLYFQFTEDGTNWITLKQWSDALSTAWSLVTIKHGHLAGLPNVRFRFIMVSDQGYNMAGCNIDNFNITPAATDTTPPFVYYTKEKDWYKAADEGGMEITTEIKDRTGIDYARVLYKVNGGTESSAEPTSVNGTTYYWKLPTAPAAGDLVEFRFDCRDTVSPTKNQSYTGPWQYREGLHQKYDSGVVSYYTYVVTTTLLDDMKSYAVRFQSFHDDITGAVVRGYTDATTEVEDGLNCDMMINVWANNAGLPGATLITPFAFPNPATLQDTNAWGYVDLKAYTALDNMAATYFIGFEARTGQTGRTLCRTVGTATGTEQEYDFGRAYIQSYKVAGGSLTWEQYPGNNHHIRCVTTDKNILPPVIVAPAPVVKTVATTATEVVNVGNDGNYVLNYEASIVFDGYLSPETQIHTNDFQSGLVYTNSGTTNWATAAGGTWNGTTTCAAVTATGTGIMTSAAFNTSAAVSDLYLDFDQLSVWRTGASVKVEYYTGAAWTQIYYNNTTLVSGHQRIALPIKSANTQLRFTGVNTKVSGTTTSWRVDNIVVTSAQVPHSWLTLDGAATTTGTVAALSTDPLTYGFNTTGLTNGNTYTATVHVDDADGVVAGKTTTVSMTVSTAPTPPAVPVQALPVNASSTSDLTPTFDWNDVATATSYTIQIDDVSTFASPNYTNSPTVSTYTPAANLPVGTWYWRVLATNANGSSAYTTPGWSVVLGNVPAVPTLALPANASSTSDLTPTFDWNDVATATAYTIQADNNSDFSSPEVTNSPTVSTYTPAANLAVGTYYWRVLATNAFGSSAYTASWTVVLGNVPAVPTLALPANASSTADLTPTFDWNDVATATAYTIQADNNSDFSSPEVTNSPTVSTYTPAANLAVGTYYWRVLATNAFGSSAYTASWTVVLGNIPAVPTLALPANASSTTDLTPTFDWNDVATATAYTIQADNNSDFSSPEVTNSPTLSTYTPAANMAAGTYYWRVLATNAFGSSAYTASWTVILGSVPAVPTLATPTNASTTYDPTPTFDWNDVATATAYTIQVDNNSDFSSPVFTQSPAVSTYTPAAALTDGTYYWRVLATNAFGSSAYTASWTVSKASMVAPTGVTTTIVSGNVKIDWTAVAGAATYDVYSSADPYGTFTKIVTDTALLTYTYTPGANTKMFFYIVAKNALTKESPETIEVEAAKRRTLKDVKLEASGN